MEEIQLNEKMPALQQIPIESKQYFFDKKINKIDVNFATEEDMLLLLLNIFLHDFAHDYNLNTIERSIRSITTDLETMNIPIGNSVIKVFKNKLMDREPYMYDDNKYVNVDTENDTIQSTYYENLYKSEINKHSKNFEQSGGENMQNDPEEFTKIAIHEKGNIDYELITNKC